MLTELKKIPVILWRDMRILSSYKLAFSMTFLSTIFNLFYFILFGNMFGSTSPALLASYGGNFISFLLIGSMGWGFLWSIVSATSTALRNEMIMGTFESILLTKTKVTTIMIAYTIYGCLFGILSMGIIVVIGFVAFGFSAFATATLFTPAIFVLSTSMMMGLGMIFGGLTIWLKNIGPMILLLQSVSMFFCGVYFPVSVLPKEIQPGAMFVPFYYSIEGLRLSLLPSSTIPHMVFFIIVLLGFSILFILLGIWLLHRGLIKAKQEGSLVYY